MSELSDVEAALSSARTRLSAISGTNDWDMFRRVDQECLSLERRLAALKGEEHAVPIDFPVSWDVGAPCPHLFANDYKTFLAFYPNFHDPNWDGTYVNVVDPGSSSEGSLVLVEFKGCVSSKLGSPNEDIQNGHPLSGRGLDGYTAQQVVNSRWLAELKATAQTHPHYQPKRWDPLRHLVFWFHDSTFECVASGFSVERFNGDFRRLIQHVCERFWTS